MENEILNLLADLCPDFSKYERMKNELYKGSLFGGCNIYYKLGTDGITTGMVTGIRNEKKYLLGSFEKNFQTLDLHKGRIEEGWTGQTLLDLLNYLKEAHR